MSGDSVRLRQDISQLQNDLIEQSNDIPSYSETNKSLGRRFEILSRAVQELQNLLIALRAENVDDTAKIEEYERRLTLLQQPLSDEEKNQVLYEKQLTSVREKRIEIIENFESSTAALSSMFRALPLQYDGQVLEEEFNCLEETSKSIASQTEKITSDIEPKMKAFKESLPTKAVDEDILNETMKQQNETAKKLFKIQELEKDIISRNDKLKKEMEEICKEFDINEDDL